MTASTARSRPVRWVRSSSKGWLRGIATCFAPSCAGCLLLRMADNVDEGRRRALMQILFQHLTRWMPRVAPAPCGLPAAWLRPCQSEVSGLTKHRPPRPLWCPRNGRTSFALRQWYSRVHGAAIIADGFRAARCRRSGRSALIHAAPSLPTGHRFIEPRRHTFMHHPRFRGNNR